MLAAELEQCIYSDSRSVQGDKTKDSEDHQGKTSVDSVFNEYLIQVVQRSPLIYDYTNENYNNAAAKQEVWDSIAESLCSTVDAVKVRWKTLRDRYQRERKRLAAEEASGRIVHSPFAHFHKMEFLNNFLGEGTKVLLRSCALDQRPAAIDPFHTVERKWGYLSMSEYKGTTEGKTRRYNKRPKRLSAMSDESRSDDLFCDIEEKRPKETSVNEDLLSIIQNKIDNCESEPPNESMCVKLEQSVESTSTSLDVAVCKQEQCTPSYGLPTNLCAQLPINSVTVPVESTSLMVQCDEEAPSDQTPKVCEEIRPRAVKPKTLLRRKKRLEKRLAAAHERIRPAVAASAAEVATFGIPNYGPITEDVLFAQSIGAKLAKIPDGPDKDRLKMTIWLSFINFSTSHQSELLPMELDAASNFR